MSILKKHSQSPKDSSRPAGSLGLAYEIKKKNARKFNKGGEVAASAPTDDFSVETEKAKRTPDQIMDDSEKRQPATEAPASEYSTDHYSKGGEVHPDSIADAIRARKKAKAAPEPIEEPEEDPLDELDFISEEHDLDADLEEKKDEAKQDRDMISKIREKLKSKRSAA